MLKIKKILIIDKIFIKNISKKMLNINKKYLIKTLKNRLKYVKKQVDK